MYERAGVGGVGRSLILSPKCSYVFSFLSPWYAFMRAPNNSTWYPLQPSTRALTDRLRYIFGWRRRRRRLTEAETWRPAILPRVPRRGGGRGERDDGIYVDGLDGGRLELNSAFSPEKGDSEDFSEI